jgi:hypothetical protein
MHHPSNIARSDMAAFQTAVAAILAQLYDGWPMPISIDRPALARTLSRNEDPSTATLSSGGPLEEFLDQVIAWLQEQDLTSHEGATPWDRVGLSGKALLALNQVERGSGETLGEQLSKAVRDGTWGFYELSAFLDGLFGRSPQSTPAAYKLRAARPRADTRTSVRR